MTDLVSGETAVVTFRPRDAENEPFDPDTVTFRVKSPAGVTVLECQYGDDCAVTRISEGVYEGRFTTTDDGTVSGNPVNGRWRVEFVGTTDEYTVRRTATYLSQNEFIA